MAYSGPGRTLYRVVIILGSLAVIAMFVVFAWGAAIGELDIAKGIRALVGLLLLIAMLVFGPPWGEGRRKDTTKQPTEPSSE